MNKMRNKWTGRRAETLGYCNQRYGRIKCLHRAAQGVGEDDRQCGREGETRHGNYGGTFLEIIISCANIRRQVAGWMDPIIREVN